LTTKSPRVPRGISVFCSAVPTPNWGWVRGVAEREESCVVFLRSPAGLLDGTSLLHAFHRRSRIRTALGTWGFWPTISTRTSSSSHLGIGARDGVKERSGMKRSPECPTCPLRRSRSIRRRVTAVLIAAGSPHSAERALLDRGSPKRGARALVIRPAPRRRGEICPVARGGRSWATAFLALFAQIPRLAAGPLSAVDSELAEGLAGGLKADIVGRRVLVTLIAGVKIPARSS